VQRAHLQLRFAAAARGSYLREQSSQAPLRCLRAFALPDGACVAQLLHIGPGILGGDRLALEVVVERGARVLLVAQSAAKLHAMHPGEHAESTVRLRVETGASLEYHPGLTIPYAASDFRQRVEVDLEPGARFLLLERWAAGRIARGERHAYRRVEGQLRVREGGRLRYADALLLEPDAAAGPAIFDGHSYLGHGVVVGGAAATPGAPSATGAPTVSGVELVTFPFAPDAHALRALAHDGIALQEAMLAVWAGQRVGGHPLPDLARYGS
jgi:urease accessory protein